MVYTITIVLILLILLYLMFVINCKVNMVFDTEGPFVNVTLLWLDPVIKGLVTLENARPVLTVLLFNKVIFRRRIRKTEHKHGKHQGMELFKAADPRDINVDIRYGFNDPFATAMACGVINAVSQFVRIDSINQRPDFIAFKDHIHIDASAKVNIGSALVNFFKIKNQRH